MISRKRNGIKWQTCRQEDVAVVGDVTKKKKLKCCNKDALSVNTLLSWSVNAYNQPNIQYIHIMYLLLAFSQHYFMC